MVAKGRKRGVHRQRRPRRPLPGMLLHIDGSEHRWFQDERWYDLLVILDDAEGGRSGGSPTPHAGGACHARVGSADDSRLLAAGAGTERAQLRYLAGPVAAGTAAG